MRGNMKKGLSVLLCLLMLVQYLPTTAFAAGEDNLCEHHAEHTAECGYAEAAAGSDCAHSHDDTCGYKEAVDEVLCTCEATDENGALVHTGGCGYIAPVAGADCTHTHDDACGYAAPVEAKPCTYHCHICHTQELVDALPGEVTAENQEAVIAQLTAIDAAKLELSDAEMEQVDFAKYSAAISAINMLQGQSGAEVPIEPNTNAAPVSDDFYTDPSASKPKEGLPWYFCVYLKTTDGKFIEANYIVNGESFMCYKEGFSKIAELRITELYDVEADIYEIYDVEADIYKARYGSKGAVTLTIPKIEGYVTPAPQTFDWYMASDQLTSWLKSGDIVIFDSDINDDRSIDYEYTVTLYPCSHETYAEGECTVCGYECPHVGGTATCVQKAVCETCGSEYGEKLAHTPDEEIGQTCLGYQCEICRNWYGEANFDNHIQTDENGLCLCGFTVYDIWVSDIRVTEVNKNNVLAWVDGGDGYPVRYDPKTNTLMLQNAKLGDMDGDGIALNVLGDITLSLSGESVSLDGMDVSGSLTINGNGNLTVSGIRTESLALGEDVHVIAQGSPAVSSETVTGEGYSRTAADAAFVPIQTPGSAQYYEFMGEDHKISYTYGSAAHTLQCACGLYVVTAEPHTLTYTADGNIITETCSANCGHSATATLELDTNIRTVYTGSAIEALKVTYSDNWQGERLNIVYSNNINVGTACGSISIGSVTATATYQIESMYTIVYNANKPENTESEITGEMADSRQLQYSEEFELPASSFQLKGYDFASWNTKADGTGTAYSAGDDVCKLTEGNTVTLYAQWKPKSYEVTFNYGGASYTQPMVYDAYSVLTTFENAGFEVPENKKFAGWRKNDGSFGGAIFGAGVSVVNLCNVDNISGNVTGYDLEPYFVDANPPAVVITKDGETYTNISVSLKLEQDGTTYSIYMKNENGVYVPESNIQIYGTYDILVAGTDTQRDIVIEEDGENYAHLEYYSVEVICDERLKSAAAYPNEPVLKGSRVEITAENIPGNGYVFDKWNTIVGTPVYDESDAYDYEAKIIVNEKTTIKAVARPINYKIVFNANKPANAQYAVTGEMSEQSFVYDIEATLNNNQYALKGYLFAGWNTKADGTGTAYTNKENIKNLTTQDGAEVILYAQWETCTHTNGTATCISKAVCIDCGLEYILNHQYIYSAENNVITETCTKGCNHTETAILEQDADVSLVYTGSAIEALKVIYSDGWMGSKALTITYAVNGEPLNAAPVNVGTYTASFTYEGASADVDFTIAKAEPTVTAPTRLTATYGDTLADVTLYTAAGDDGTWTWKDPATVVQVENDGYTAVFTPTDTTHYTTKEVTLSVKVSPRVLTITGAVVKDKEYDGDTHTEVENVTFSGLFGSDTLVMGTDYTAKAFFDNIIVGEDKSVSVSVTLLNPNYRLSDDIIRTSADMLPRKIYQSVYFNPDSLVYNGEPQKPFVGIVDGDIDSGRYIHPADYTVTFENNVNAGDMTVRVRSDMYLFYQNGDFVSELVLTVPIEKAPVGIGTRYKTVYVGDEMPELEYVVSGLLNNDELLTAPTLTTSADLTKPGAYPITAAGADAGSNYAISYESGLLLVLDRAPATADNVTPEDKAALEDAKEELENLIAENEGLLTESQTMALWNELQIVEDALKALGNAQNVTDAITQLPDTVEPDDEEAAEKILDAKEAYDELTDHEKSLVDETTKKKLDDLVAALTDYDIIKGDGGKWTKGSSSGLSFTANGPFSKFVGIEVDGKEVAARYYDAKAGSTIITLKQSYLRWLSTGEYTITVLYTDGETSGTFKILAASSTPATGDDSNIMLYGSMFTMSLAALVVLLLASKKRKQAS